MNVERIDSNIVKNGTKNVQRAAMCDEISLQKTSNVSVVTTNAVETAAMSSICGRKSWDDCLSTANRLHLHLAKENTGKPLVSNN